MADAAPRATAARRYVLLAALIEVITAEPLERYIEREVIAPLDLGDTGLAARDSDVAQLSAGHDAKGRRDDAAYRDDGIAPIGGLYATVDDLVVWARAQTDPSARSAACIAAPSGWAQGERFGRRAMWHAGLTNSHAGFVPRFRDEDSLIVALGNRGGKSAALAPLVKSLAAFDFPVAARAAAAPTPALAETPG